MAGFFDKWVFLAFTIQYLPTIEDARSFNAHCLGSRIASCVEMTKI